MARNTPEPFRLTFRLCIGVKYSLMKQAVIGMRVHSGWGALVAVARGNALQIVERCKIVIIDPQAPGAMQPYHYVELMPLAAAEKHIAHCAAASSRLALEALTQISAQLRDRGFFLAGSAILLSFAKPLPPLDRVLSSHALIHTAEGEFFRQALRSALERLQVPVTGIRERDLEEHAAKTFGRSAAAIRRHLDTMGRSLGPPWTKDQKTAALAAAIVLA
jgi:hypothetical protein